MYLSRYNFFWNNQDNFFIYNSLSNTFLKVDKDLFFELNRDINIETKKLPEELVKYLEKNFILINEIEDDLNFYKRNIFSSRFDNDILNLTIAPTTNCNFACQYCYENGIKGCSINIETEDALINYIEKNIAKIVRIDWYGGEPLLKFDSIIRISKSIKKMNKKLVSGMVTNGYLLTPEKVMQLKEFNFKNIQITLDGIFADHDSSRSLINGKGTFRQIINNIFFILNNTDISCLIRVNIGKHKNKYKEVQRSTRLSQQKISKWKILCI